MVRKALSLSNFIIFCVSVLVIGCAVPDPKIPKNIFEKIDVSQIPNVTIFDIDTLLTLKNGVYYYGEKPFSGYIKSAYDATILQSIGSYLQGKQHGTTKTFFPNGTIESERNYKDGIGYGRHFGFWENGKIKFDFMYFNDKREGIQKQWYESGSPYYELTFTDDKENGMQKAWRENGKLYINYEVKDGMQYGLKKSALCYTLEDEKFK